MHEIHTVHAYCTQVFHSLQVCTHSTSTYALTNTNMYTPTARTTQKNPHAHMHTYKDTCMLPRAHTHKYEHNCRGFEQAGVVGLWGFNQGIHLQGFHVSRTGRCSSPCFTQ